MITHERSLKEFSNQINYVVGNYSDHGITTSDISNVVLGGLGGSGIAGAITKSWAFDKLDIPLETVSDYNLPAYVNDKTLVILNSYSGNTEETLNLLSEALEAKARIIVLTSGGEIGNKADDHGLKKYIIEPGYQPRQTIGYGLAYMLMIISELMSGDSSASRTELKKVITFFEEEGERQFRSAESLFSFFISSVKNKFVILADKQFYPVALRFAQQINENAKLEAFVHLIPESNHNVIESYVDRLPTNFMLLYGTENPRIDARFDFIAGHLELENNKVLPMRIGQYDMLSLFDMIYRLDWTSVLLAQEIGAPLMEVPIISELKDYLASIEIVEEDEDTD